MSLADVGQDDLRRFAPLYRNTRYLGAADTLRRHLGVGDDYVLPLGLTHGVDFGHIDPCQDLMTIEPIHWAHNPSVLAAARTIKPSVAIPHPFMLVLLDRTPQPGSGMLVIGPPPGPTNDRRLLAELRKFTTPRRLTMLVKPRGDHRRSMDFWRSNGIEPITMAEFGPSTYETMFDVLEPFETVIGCTFSSVVICAAAMRRRIKLLRGYRYDCFDLIEPSGSFESVNWGARAARSVVRAFVNEEQEAIHSLARRLLGSDLDADPSRLLGSLEQMIGSLRSPVFSPKSRAPLAALVRREAALRLNKPALVRFAIAELLRARFSRQVYARDLDEIGLWLDGPNDGNFAERRVGYVKGVTEPGAAVDAY